MSKIVIDEQVNDPASENLQKYTFRKKKFHMLQADSAFDS